jgi:hypothetical protein
LLLSAAAWAQGRIQVHRYIQGRFTDQKAFWTGWRSDEPG